VPFSFRVCLTSACIEPALGLVSPHTSFDRLNERLATMGYQGVVMSLANSRAPVPLGVPLVETGRLRLRAFRASDLNARAAMQANPEVMRYLVTGRTSTPVEV